MDTMASLLLTLLLAAGPAAPGQQPQPPPSSPEAQESQPAPLPRVVGQARSQEELDAWSAIERSRDLPEKEGLARQFLETYPDSGLTAYVHYSLASSYRRANLNEQFIEAAEKALVELPSLPEISSYLAFLYAETGNGEKAELWATQTLRALDSMSRPESVSAADWVRAQSRSRGDAHYALGRADLGRAMTLKDGAAAKEALSRAAGHFNDSIREDPDNPYASFRLGSVHRNLGQPEEALQAYARTAALGGVIEPYARKSLQEAFESLGRDPSGMEAEIDRQKRLLEEEKARREEQLRQLDERESPASDQVEPVAKPPI